MLSGGKMFLCVTGRMAYATDNGMVIGLGSTSHQDRENVTTVCSQFTAASSTQFDTDVAAAVAGTVITDGAIQWRCLSVTSSNLGQVYSGVSPLTEAHAGFDPFGVLRRAMRAIEANQTDLPPKVIIRNGQSDAGYGSAIYSSALQTVGKYFANRGWTIFVGLSVFNAAAASTANYDLLSSGVTAAITAMKGVAGTSYKTDQIQTGADLYALIRTTGAMASGGA
jgi:hypothetical protein